MDTHTDLEDRLRKELPNIKANGRYVLGYALGAELHTIVDKTPSAVENRYVQMTSNFCCMSTEYVIIDRDTKERILLPLVYE